MGRLGLASLACMCTTGSIGQFRTPQVDAPPERVWNALTDPDQVAQYMMGSRAETDWKPGSPITWSGQWKGEPYQDKGEVRGRAGPPAGGYPRQPAKRR
ncbi:SRPBCC family protein [Leekyejoonella antrihumi]|uniref:Activator of Hsp90 ATPase homologue 1/2-like C-terminal domain-containing protein n=1 Tax=Leekyejoonella antrihumi TaxID=1660198 RepID=A0A563E3H7_9MICO|nr:SRPBCC family protein [Leekyejoonella antrihumi]TWP36965.1 hypothetical protein FGL98_07860 [Leekyejoonella antrihumi]